MWRIDYYRPDSGWHRGKGGLLVVEHGRGPVVYKVFGLTRDEAVGIASQMNRHGWYRYRIRRV